MSARFEYEALAPGQTEWRRASFAKRQDLGYPDPPTGRLEALEMLTVIASKWKPGTRLRLVHIEEEVDAEEVQPLVQG